MNNQMTISLSPDDLKTGITTDKALKLFDGLAPITLESMIGRWVGAEIPTQHPMDGLLEASNWHGKHFIDADHVHPLILSGRNGQTYSTIPLLFLMNLGLRVPLFKKPFMKPINGIVTRLVQTQKSHARIRMINFRGKTSATMIYDRLPIHDHFRKFEDGTLMGLMDFKGQDRFYFFMLKREQ